MIKEQALEKLDHILIKSGKKGTQKKWGIEKILKKSSNLNQILF